MAKILITGATGFIGGWLLRYFLDQGHQIIAHGSSEDSTNNLRNKCDKFEVNVENIEFWSQDFKKKKWIFFPDIDNVDAIIHTAAATRVRKGIIENYDDYFNLNVIAPKKLAKKAFEIPVKHFIYLSTGQVFGISKEFPITEKTPKNPINLYGFSKLIGELVISSLGTLGLRYTIARPFSVYGKGHYNIISIITEKIESNDILTIYGDGSQSRAFLHVIDFCRAIDLILFNEKCYGKEYNISGPKEYSVNYLVQLISSRLKARPKIEYKEPIVDELKRNIADLDKIMELGFRPTESLENFIKNILI